jgi:tRNA U34 5-methylaminomethyl-2-thiouridine-forming methyltransferase MnmC
MDTILTEDGSFTMRSDQFGETYHSVYGARSESEHVFISAGYGMTDKNPLSVLEMGFGSGLNAWLTLLEAEKLRRKTLYTALERFPLGRSQWEALNQNRQGSEAGYFKAIHEVAWNQQISVTDFFFIRKLQVDIMLWKPDDFFDVVYYDAFSPEVQPELWSADVLSKVREVMNPGGIFTTYCAKGIVRRTLQSLGFEVERIPGPRGKREMIRARVRS